MASMMGETIVVRGGGENYSPKMMSHFIYNDDSEEKK